MSTAGIGGCADLRGDDDVAVGVDGSGDHGIHETVSVKLRGVYVVDAVIDGMAENSDRNLGVLSMAIELHCAVTDAGDPVAGQRRRTAGGGCELAHVGSLVWNTRGKWRNLRLPEVYTTGGPST